MPTTMKKKRSNSNKGKKTVPEKGDPNFLTPTQLRNRRKRRAKQQKSGNGPSNDVAVGGDRNGPVPNERNDACQKDPSMKYIADPTKAPIVAAARAYFQSTTTDFRVHLGPRRGWRTVSKLAVRPDPRTKHVAIGLFLPHSHSLLPVPACPAHHPAINRAVACIAHACRAAGVVPYSSDAGEDAGSAMPDDEGSGRGGGQLKYVAINVARATGAVQVTLVWNTPPPPLEDSEEGEHGGESAEGGTRVAIPDPVLEKLVSKLISLGNEEKSQTLGIVGGAGSQPTEAPGPKKKRRRGRRGEESTATQVAHSAAPAERADRKQADIPNQEGAPAAGKSADSPPPTLDLHSLWINYNAAWKHSNAIFAFDASSWRHVHGPRAVVEHLALGGTPRQLESNALASPTPPSFPIPLTFPPNVFRQANLDAFANIIGRIRERVQTLVEGGNENLSCMELYGGVGTIGLHISDIVASLVSSDENPNNARCFHESVSELPAPIRRRLVYKPKNAADMVTSEPALFEKCDVLIVDPPRKGLDREVVEYLCAEGCDTMKLVIYISCGFPAFRRDCDALLASGRWKVEFAEGYLLFPGSDAIETLAFFVPA